MHCEQYCAECETGRAEVLPLVQQGQPGEVWTPTDVGVVTPLEGEQYQEQAVPSNPFPVEQESLPEPDEAQPQIPGNTQSSTAPQKNNRPTRSLTSYFHRLKQPPTETADVVEDSNTVQRKRPVAIKKPLASLLPEQPRLLPPLLDEDLPIAQQRVATKVATAKIAPADQSPADLPSVGIPSANMAPANMAPADIAPFAVEPVAIEPVAIEQVAVAPVAVEPKQDVVVLPTPTTTRAKVFDEEQVSLIKLPTPASSEGQSVEQAKETTQLTITQTKSSVELVPANEVVKPSAMSSESTIRATFTKTSTDQTAEKAELEDAAPKSQLSIITEVPAKPTSIIQVRTASKDSGKKEMRFKKTSSSEMSFVR